MLVALLLSDLEQTHQDSSLKFANNRNLRLIVAGGRRNLIHW